MRAGSRHYHRFARKRDPEGIPVKFGHDTVMGIILVASGGLTIAYVRTASAYVRAALRTLRIFALIGAAAAIVIGLLLFFGLA
jgi:hypothetical protein